MQYTLLPFACSNLAAAYSLTLYIDNLNSAELLWNLYDVLLFYMRKNSDILEPS